MSRIDYASRSPRRHSPIKYRSQRSRSRERYGSRRSPFNIRNRPPIHQRLSERSRSIEKRLSYPSKHEVDKRSSYRRSRSPRRRRRSSSRSNSRHRSRSRSRRRSRQQSRSRSKDREERSGKFASYFQSTSDMSDLLLNNKPIDNYLRDFGMNSTSNEMISYNYLQPLIDKPPLLEPKQLPLLDKSALYDNQFNDEIYYDNQMNMLNPLNQQLNQINHLKMNSINNHYLNQTIPNHESVDFGPTNTPNISRALRERLDVHHPSTSSNVPLLETPSNYINSNPNLYNNLGNSGPMNNSLNSNNHLNSNSHSVSLNANNHQSSNNNTINNLDNGYFNRGGQDVDLRSSGSNNIVYKESLLGNAPGDPTGQTLLSNPEQNEKCMFSHLGCPITTNKDVISKHEIECLYNPRNVKAFCNKCKLTVCPEHDCIHELRTELNQTKIRTNYCLNTIKLTNTSLLSNDYDQQIISIHYSVDNKEIIKQVKINKADRIDFILKQAVDLIFSKENLMRLNKSDRDFQLICNGLYTFLPELSFNKSTKLQLPLEPDNHLHLTLIEKKLIVKVAVKRLFYQNQHIIVSVPAAVPFSIDPTKRICDLKEMISEKIPVQWDKHRLTINNKEFKDYQILYSIGLSNGDRVEIEAY